MPRPVQPPCVIHAVMVCSPARSSRTGSGGNRSEAGRVRDADFDGSPSAVSHRRPRRYEWAL
jgi:hypothetical protein